MSQQADQRKASCIRKEKYKKILEKGSRIAEESDAFTVIDNLNKVTDLVKASNELIAEGKTSDRIGHTSEVVLDAQCLKMSHDLLTSTVQKIENFQFSDDAFAAALRKFVSNDNSDLEWNKLDDMVIGMAKTAFYSQPMYGAFDMAEDAVQPEATQRQRQQRPRAQIAEEKRPQQLTQQVVVGEDKGAQKLQRIMEQITEVYNQRGKKPLPYFEVIIDPENMMYTFDNAFSISFMFRDSKVGFTTGDDGQAAIYPVTPENKPANTANKQFLVTLDHDLLERMIEKYSITEPMLTINRADRDMQLE